MSDRKYWLVNLRTKEYTSFCDEDFFDGDWKLKTPFANEDYIDIMVVRAWPHQTVNEYMIWGNDLCRDGMIVGLYFDKAHVSMEQAMQFIRELSQKQDVAQHYIHELSFIEFSTKEQKF